MIKRLTFFITIILIVSAFGQQKKPTGRIEGRVLDETRVPLIGANVRIENTLIGSATDRKGNFRLTKVPAGSHKLKVTMVGYESKELEVEVVPDQTTFIEVQLFQTAIQTSEVFVTASKFEQKTADIPLSISALSPQDLTSRNIKRLDDALKYVSGINMTSDQISIRGSTGYTRGAGSRVLLLFDGVPLYTGDAGDIIWQLIPVFEIERIEIVKSASSALYGSQALGGVINVLSKDFSGRPITNFRAIGGMYDKPFYDEWNWSPRKRFYNSLTLSHSRKIGDLGLYLSATRFEDDSYKMNSYTKRYSFFGKAKYNLNPTNSLTFLINGSTYKSGSFLYWRDSRNALIPPESQIGQWTKALRFNLHFNYQSLYSTTTLINFRNSWFHNFWEDNTESANSSRSEMLRSELSFNYFGNDIHKLVGGIEATYITVSSNIFSNPSGTGLALFGQDEIRLSKKFILTTGLRVDYQKIENVLSELNFNPKLAGLFRISENLILRSSVGRGYRAPTPSELFSTTNVSGIRVIPNPDLNSESNWTLEAGLNHTLSDHFKWDVAFFNNEIYNFIEPSIDPVTSFIQFKNITRARIYGTEININSELFNNLININLGYTYLWSRDLKNNLFLKYRPRHLLYVNINSKLNFLRIGLDARYWNRIETIDEDLIRLNIVKDGDLRDKVFLLDVNCTLDLFEFKIPGRLTFSINNLLNYNYIEMIGNLGPVRSFSLGIEGIL